MISSLEEYKKKCENDGNYMEARAAAQRLNGVKVHFKTVPENTKKRQTLPCYTHSSQNKRTPNY